MKSARNLPGIRESVELLRDGNDIKECRAFDVNLTGKRIMVRKALNNASTPVVANENNRIWPWILGKMLQQSFEYQNAEILLREGGLFCRRRFAISGYLIMSETCLILAPLRLTSGIYSGRSFGRSGTSSRNI